VGAPNKRRTGDLVEAVGRLAALGHQRAGHGRLEAGVEEQPVAHVEQAAQVLHLQRAVAHRRLLAVEVELALAVRAVGRDLAARGEQLVHRAGDACRRERIVFPPLTASNHQEPYLGKVLKVIWS